MNTVKIINVDRWGANVRIERAGHYPLEYFVIGAHVVGKRDGRSLPTGGEVYELAVCQDCGRELWLEDGQPPICNMCAEDRRQRNIDEGVFQATTWDGESELVF